MKNREAEVSDIYLVLKAPCAENLDQTVAELKRLGMEIEQTDADNGVVEGTIGADKLAELRKSPCVDYVRVDFTYIAEYPAGDLPNDSSNMPDEESAD